MTGSNNKVILGMSGGVDSSTSALILKDAGYDVYGVMLRTWRLNQETDEMIDSEKQLVENTQITAENLGISFQFVDVREAFQRIVIGYFKEAYINGLTPNPCMICNREVKWTALIDIADKLGAAWVSTGHYARLVNEDGQVYLKKGRDHKKDQTYFLSHLTQEILQRTIFPLGEYTKEEIRSIAKANQISAVNLPESQDLCFLGGSDYRSYMLDFLPESIIPGEIVSVSGDMLGHHNGLANYTIGQRKGLGVFRSRPLYVIRKDVQKNRLIVGFEEQLGTDQFFVTQLNWINGQIPCNNFSAQVKIRYQAKLMESEINKIDEDRFMVKTNKPLRDVTPGQFAVFYNEDIVLGGGTISTNVQD